jgi:hypothetical protein
MQRALQTCWSRSAAPGQVQFFAAIFQHQNHVLSFSTAPKQTILNKSQKNILKSGKDLGEKADEVLEKVVNLDINSPPLSPSPQEKTPQRKRENGPSPTI